MEHTRCPLTVLLVRVYCLWLRSRESLVRNLESRIFADCRSRRLSETESARNRSAVRFFNLSLPIYGRASEVHLAGA